MSSSGAGGVGAVWPVAAARCGALYALHVYLPASTLARTLRRGLRTLGGVAQGTTQLPQVAWPQVLERHPVRLVETQKRDGNVSLSELAVLAQAATGAQPGSAIIEIGTFDGRTAINLAVNARRGVSIATLDLPASLVPALPIEHSERRYVDKPEPGARLRACGSPWWVYADRVAQWHGDSATFDWSPHYGRAGMVFVDGSHAYEYARRDSETALRLVQPHGVVLWHDYGVWSGVTRALEELEASQHLGLRHIRGTSLVFWRAPEAVATVPEAPAGQEYEDELHLAPTEAIVDEVSVSRPTVGTRSRT